MKYLLILLFLFSPLGLQQIFAQSETANWYFGDRAGLSFNTSPPSVLRNGKLQTLEGCSAISDGQGNLLFYTDGSTVYNKQHKIMQNGTGLSGNVSSTQSSIVIPKPGSYNKYYIFTVDKPGYDEIPDDPIQGVNYSEVDMSLNAGLGGIVASNKNIHLITYNPNDPVESQFQSSEKLSAVLSSNCSSYWVVTQFVDKFYAFEVTQGGVNTTPVISTSPNSVPPLLTPQQVNVGALGYMKISPNGKKLAIAFSSTALRPDNSNNKASGKVFLYDFNDGTGKVSNEQLILDNTYPYGVEFSPKTSKLYITANIYDSRDVLLNSDLYQYDLESSNISSSQKTINSSNNVAGALQLAMNDKIYRAGYPIFTQSHHFLSVINDPEALGTNSNYAHNSVNLSPYDVKLGLPPFVQSFFLDNFTFENTCIGDSTHFSTSGNETYDNVFWDFGDGTTSSIIEPDHTYTKPGNYTVVLQRYKSGKPQDPVCKQVIITDFPKILQKYELAQCDIADSNSADGIAQFNLELAKDPVTLGDEDTQILFYIDYNSAINDITNQNSLGAIYTNQTRDQVLFAKVLKLNSECYEIAEVTLHTKDGVEINASPAKGCDLGNGMAEFNLENIANRIKTEFNLATDIQLTFYESASNANLGSAPLSSPFSSSEKTIYLRAIGDEGCYGSGSLDLKINPFPIVNTLSEFQACSSQFPLTIGTDIPITEAGNYNYLWSDGQTSQQIQVNSGGTYSLEITSKELGCGKTLEYNVSEIVAPTISGIEMSSNGDTSDITILTESAVPSSFSIDNIDGPYQDSSVFNNIPPGEHTIFVKNDNGCEIKQKEISVFGFPTFFTPNNDGYNDRWKPIEIEDPAFKIKELYIYDRYGKLLKQLVPDGPGWDGTFIGKNMPSDDYWFSAKLINAREFRGHFSLVR